ncbi:MAG: hypothetical protein ABEJ30_01480 [Halorientalis sp.]
MKLSRVKRDARLTLLGRPWWVPVLGAVVTATYSFAMVGIGSVGVNLGAAGYAGGIVGGAVAGAALGTNWHDGMMAGLRAGLHGALAVVGVFVVGTFAVLYLQSGLPFPYWSSALGAIVAMFLVPVYAFTGALAGSLGVLCRRFVLPRRYNPPAY